MSNQFKITRKGLTLEINEDWVDSPREYDRDDNIGTIVCFHSRLELGDENTIRDEKEFNNWYKDHKEEIAAILPIYLYDDEKISISTEKDGIEAHFYGQVGWIYCTKERLKECWFTDGNEKKEWIEDKLEEEIFHYDNWLNNYPPYYSFSILDKDKNELHSQGVFEFDDYKDMIEEMIERNEKPEYNYLFQALLKRERENCL